jgi:hypothetical protein
MLSRLDEQCKATRAALNHLPHIPKLRLALFEVGGDGFHLVG